MKNRILLLPLLITLIWSMPIITHSGDIVGTHIVTEDYSEGMVKRDNGKGFKVFITVLDDNGVFKVCAAISGVQTSNFWYKHDRTVIRRLKFLVDETVDFDGFRWARLYSTRSKPIGRTANCRLISVAVTAGSTFSLRLPIRNYGSSSRHRASYKFVQKSVGNPPIN